MTSPMDKESPPARVVTDFHRHSDVDSAYEAQHHTTGKDRYQHSSGDHVHDGSSGEALLDDVTIGGNLGTTDLGNAVKQLIIALGTHLGLKDNTTQV